MTINAIKCRSENASSADLIKVAAVLVQMNQAYIEGTSKDCFEILDITMGSWDDCSTMIVLTNLTTEQLAALVFNMGSQTGFNRIWQTMNYCEEYTGEEVRK